MLSCAEGGRPLCNRAAIWLTFVIRRRQLPTSVKGSSTGKFLRKGSLYSSYHIWLAQNPDYIVNDIHLHIFFIRKDNIAFDKSGRKCLHLILKEAVALLMVIQNFVPEFPPAQR